MEQKPGQKAKQESNSLKNITEQEIVSQSVAAEALQILQNKFKIHLIWASVVLVVIGWFGYTSLQEVKNEVIQKAGSSRHKGGASFWATFEDRKQVGVFNAFSVPAPFKSRDITL